MKAAPPPPPPPAPRPSATASSAQGGQIASDPSLSLSRGQPAGAAGQRPASTDSPANWPGWFGITDLLAILLLVVAAFLAASFAARNSDLWLHLAAGQRLWNGTYSLGTDPFSYTAANRVWLNFSWLYDLCFYAVYSLDPQGSFAVGLKAAGFTLALILPAVFFRRPGQSLWPWVLVAAFGVLAAAPHAQLRPLVMSMLFLTMTLIALHCCPWQGNSWRKPAGIAVLFLLWANLDEWFFLGPVIVAVMLLGELLQRLLLGETAAESASDAERHTSDPFRPPPPVSGLVKTLLLGLAASLVNPTLLLGLSQDPGQALLQLVPAELGWTLPAEVNRDPSLRTLSLSPISEAYVNEPTRGKNLNGFAVAVLLAGGAVVLAADYRWLRASHVLIWLAFVGLSLESYRLIPLFAVIAVPVVGGHLNGLFSRIQPGPAASQKARILLTLAIVCRCLLVLFALVMALSAWPGWLHGHRFSLDPAYAYRVEWVIAPQTGYVRAAEQLERWRSVGSSEASPLLPPDWHGYPSQIEFANYCTWFAPSEKLFITGQYTLHAQEWPDWIALRQAIGGNNPDAAKSQANQLQDLCERHHLRYLVLTTAGRVLNLEEVVRLTANLPSWGLWHLDGQSAIVGPVTDAVGKSLRFNPVPRAFGPNVEPVPEITVVSPPAREVPLFEQYVAQPKLPSVWADDALIYTLYADKQNRLVQQQWQTEQQREYTTRAAVLGFAAVIMVAATAPPPPDDAALSLPLLAVRAAYRAIAETPDRPEGYRALAEAWRNPLMPIANPNEVPWINITARVQFLERIPLPGQLPTRLGLEAAETAKELAEWYERTGQLDLAREAIQKAIAYTKAVVADDPGEFLRRFPPGQKIENLTESVLKAFQLDQLEARITKTLQNQNDSYRQAIERGKLTPAQRFYLALRSGLPGAAITQYHEADEGAFGTDNLAVSLQLLQAELRAGRLADAVRHIEQFQKQLNELDQSGKTVPPAVRSELRGIMILAWQLAGNYREASELLQEQARNLQTLPADLLRLARPTAAMATGAVASAAFAALQFQDTAPLREELLAESLYFFTQGIYSLHAGLNNQAAQWFEQSFKPQGVTLTEYGIAGRYLDAMAYLRLIRESANLAKSREDFR